MGQAQELLFKLRLAEPALSAVASRFWSHPELSRMLPEFFLALHAVMEAGIELMSVARRRSQDLSADDVASSLNAYLERHVAEEEQHASWLREDMAALDLEPAREAAFVVPRPVVTLVGAQYYWIHHSHPVSILGYLLAIEGHPPAVDALDEIQQRTQQPPRLFRTLREHAALDHGHRRELLDLMDQLPLSRPQMALISRSALFSMEQVACLLQEIEQGQQAASSSVAS